MLTTPWEKWDGRVTADRQNSDLRFRGGGFTFDQLVEERRREDLAREVTQELWRERHQACQTAIATLAQKFEDAEPDTAVIIGNDQHELFTEENIPAFSVFWGETIENRPRTAEQTANLPTGVAIAERGHAPPEDAVYPGHTGFGRHIIESLMEDEFDVGQSAKIPKGSGYINGVSHAFGFVYRRIMNDRVIPNVPVNLNTFYPPNQPTAERCYKFGKALKRAIDGWDGDKTVAVIASGGLSHYVIDETVDRPVLDTIRTHNAKGLSAIPESHYQSGTSEIKNWVPLSAIMTDFGLDMTLLDYIPCYRSEAGTGNAMGFAYWE